MSLARMLVSLALAGTASLTTAATTVLGLPLGKPFDQKIPRCPSTSEPDASYICWLEAPPVRGHAYSGYLHAPAPDKRPAWAANAMFKIGLDAQGKVGSISVTSFESNPRVIAKSISARFGPPKIDMLIDASLPNASWKSKDVNVLLYCRPTECRVTFSDPAQDLTAEAARRAVEAARPIAP